MQKLLWARKYALHIGLYHYSWPMLLVVHQICYTVVCRQEKYALQLGGHAYIGNVYLKIVYNFWCY